MTTPSDIQVIDCQALRYDRGAIALRYLGQALFWLTLVALLVLAWPIRFGGPFGLTYVSGHSMDGTYRSGDLLLTYDSPGRGDGYEVGDVVVYRIPQKGLGGNRVVHRIVDQTFAGYVTQGDNNPSVDPWFPTTADIDGKVVLRIPLGGEVLRYALNPLALTVLCALVVAVCVYRFIAPTPQPRDPDDPDTAVSDLAEELLAGARPLPKSILSEQESIRSR